MTEKLSLPQARKLALLSQGLLKRSPFGSGKKGVLAAIRQLGYVQLDTINVIRRAHNHILWTRVPGYKSKWLDQLQVRDRQVFEYWSHATAYLPIEAYRFCLPRMRQIAQADRHWFEVDEKVVRYVLERLRAEGPLMARDFDNPEHKSGPWWDWKPAKIALEKLFHGGEIMVVVRKNFQKVYDLPERVLPASVDTTYPSEQEYCRHLITSAIQAHGFVTAAEAAYLRKGMARPVARVAEEMVAAGELIELDIEGLDGQTYYTTGEHLNHAAGLRVGSQVHLLSPFDNLVIQRKRVQQLFGFDYQLECYVPPAKRQFGYFTLPILWRGRLVGRLDPKADRRHRRFLVRNLVLEPDFKALASLAQPLAVKLRKLARFNECDEICVQKTQPAAFRDQLTRALAASA